LVAILLNGQKWNALQMLWDGKDMNDWKTRYNRERFKRNANGHLTELEKRELNRQAYKRIKSRSTEQTERIKQWKENIYK